MRGDDDLNVPDSDAKRGDIGHSAGGRPVYRGTVAQAAARLASADTLLLTCHRGPDGDSVGSLVALASLLRAQGKKATLYNPDPVPRRLKWLPLAKRFSRKLGKKARYEVTVIVDCADAKLLGSTFPAREVTGDLIVLDHHSSAKPFGDLYLCDPEAASAGVLIARIADQLGWPITDDAAIGLYVSLVSDTGSFSYANSNPEAFHLAASLVEGGVDPWTVHAMLNERATLERYKILCKALETLELKLDGKVAFMTITRKMVKEAGATWDDTTDLVNYSRALDGVECGVLFTPAKFGGVRVSMRSKGAVDCGRICEEQGGGGHRAAAGCVIRGNMAKARSRVESALAQALDIEQSGEQPPSEPGADREAPAQASGALSQDISNPSESKSEPSDPQAR
ncbi:MAG: DHH family phosphoesterase [Proteobacteria bacterium]|nr:DHH family phosphoesterase [Pseudomonadota bacterium]